METTCVSLITELQKIWDEVGEPEKDRDIMLLELEKECLEAYRRKVDEVSRFRAQLQQAVADSEAELAHICASLGEQPLPVKQLEPSCLKKKLAAILSQLEMMQKKKRERKLQFTEILDKIRSIVTEPCTSTEDKSCIPIIDESDLSLRRLEEFKIELHALEKEKSDQLKQVLDHLDTLHSLCVVLGMDFSNTVSEIHHTLENPGSKKSTSADTIKKLSDGVNRLNELKIQRLRRVQDLAKTMVEIWNLMEISNDEQQPFQNVIRYIAASENEVNEPNALSWESIKFAETEISRLQQMKASKIKEVLLKKKADLEQLCRQAHMPLVTHGAIHFSSETLESGAIDPSYLLDQVEFQISKAKEEAFSRKHILEKIDKWLAACEEETWLEEYNRDHNRYNSGRGTHLLLKRAERARVLVHKIPAAMVETLREKARTWELKRGVALSYDGVSLLSMLDEYEILKHVKDEERQRRRDQKRLEGQVIADGEVGFGSKASSGKKVVKAASAAASKDRQNSVAWATPKQNQTSNLINHYHSSSHAKTSAGNRNLASNKSKTRTAAARKPLSPFFNANTHDLNSTLPLHTPSKTKSSPGANEDHMKTPSSTSSSMKMAITHGAEFSFEEIRAARFPLET